jgi:hypothetical protein
METKPDMMQAALEYAKRGWKVFPVHAPLLGGCSCRNPKCDHVGKHPRVKWSTEATTDTNTIQRWWKKWPDANIGVVTGSPSGIFVLDKDDKNGGSGSQSLQHLIETNGKLPETLRSTTGSGEHFYFLHPGIKVPTRVNDFADGLDVRGDGGYVVAPPSLHANGRRYECREPRTAIATAPDWLLGLVTAESVPELKVSSQGTDNSIPGGERNNTLFKLVCLLLGSGMQSSEVVTAAFLLNQQRCKPPLADSEVIGIVESAARYDHSNAKKRRGARTDRSPLYWFKFRVTDFLSDPDIQIMTDYQFGWHIRLLSFAWQKAGVLPSDVNQLFKLTGASSPKKFKAEYRNALYGFEETMVGGQTVLVNHHQVAQYADALEKWGQTIEARGHRGNKTIESPELTLTEKAA